MHPETYLAETPVLPNEVTLQVPEGALSTPWKKLKRDVLGEFFFSVILQQFLQRRRRDRAPLGGVATAMNCLAAGLRALTPRVCDCLGHAGRGHGIFPELSQAPGVKIPVGTYRLWRTRAAISGNRIRRMSCSGGRNALCTLSKAFWRRISLRLQALLERVTVMPAQSR